MARQNEEKAQRQIETQHQLNLLSDWIDTQLAQNNYQVPRMSDIIAYAYRDLGFRQLSKGQISKMVRLHPAYHMNMSQQRKPHRSRQYRPIIVQSLGHLHADLGYFSKSRDYETPKTFQAGYLVARDVLSRFTYTVVLRKNKSADSLVRAFTELLAQHAKAFPNGHSIKSISFDKETSVMSHKVQQFFRDKGISFHAFQFSASKSKHAENAIRLIRTKMARLLRVYPNRRWWNTLQIVVDSLNQQPLKIGSKMLKWRPVDVTSTTLYQFLTDLYKANPTLQFAQFQVDPSLVQFKFAVGSWVRPKLLITSSAVIGSKRSEINLSDLFQIKETIAYITANYSIGKAYRCINAKTREEDIFDEDDLAESYNVDSGGR